jgi:hypothetical protein
MTVEQLIDEAARVLSRIEAAGPGGESSRDSRGAASRSGGGGPRRRKGRRGTADVEGIRAVLSKRGWAALVNVLGPCGDPHLRSCRDSIAAACKPVQGDVTVSVECPYETWATLLQEFARRPLLPGGTDAAVIDLTGQLARHV